MGSNLGIQPMGSSRQAQEKGNPDPHLRLQGLGLRADAVENVEEGAA